jgi:hypothetical protein
MHAERLRSSAAPPDNVRVLAADSTGCNAQFAMTRLRARTLLILLTVAFVTILIGVGRWHRTSLTPTAANNIFTDALPASMKHFVSGSLPESAFEWNTTKAPEWLAHPINSGRPLRLRVAIITHPSEFERRHAVRELVLKGVPREEVLVEHLFFLGHVSDLSMNDQVVREAAVHGDIELLDMSDSKTTLGTKRWEALRWVRPHVNDPSRSLLMNPSCIVRGGRPE